MKRFVRVGLLLLCSCLLIGAGNEPVVPLPDSNKATFRTDSRNTWQNEIPSVLGRYFPVGFVVSGGIHGTSTTCLSSAFATEAFTNQAPITFQQDHVGALSAGPPYGGSVAIDYAAQGVPGCTAGTTVVRVIVCSISANSVAPNFVRVTGSNYFTNYINTAPIVPGGCTGLMDVTITNGAIVSITSIAASTPVVTTPNVVIPSVAIAALGPPTQGKVSRLADGGAVGAAVMGDGTSWTCLEAKSQRVRILTCPPYNAVGNGVADDTVAIQAAINAAGNGELVYCSTGKYKVTSPIVINKTIGFIGPTRASCVITTANNIPILHIDTTVGDIYFIDINNISFENTVGGSTSAGILIDGPNSFRRGSIHHNRFSGSLYGIKLTPTIGSGVVDWTNITNNLFDNSGLNQTNYGIYHTAGGTGDIIAGNHFITTIAGIYMKGPGIGDMLINGNHFEGGTNSIYLENTAPFTYGARFIITGNKMDTVVQPVFLIHITDSTITGNRYVGSTSIPVLTDVNSVRNVYDSDYGQGISFSGKVAVGTTTGARKLTVLDETSSESFQIKLGANQATFNYDLGRNTGEGLLHFYGNQTGANGYVFEGVDRVFMRLNNNGAVIIPNLQTTGAASGKKMVCVDTTTGQLYASSTGTGCDN